MSTSTMRAVLVKDGKGPIESLHIGEASVPTLKPHQVLVKVKAFGLNRMDISQRQGKYPVPPGASEILGVEFSGTIARVHVGDSVSSQSQWKEGDEVFGLVSGGAYAEFVAAPEKNLMRKPAHLSWVQAASVPEAFLTAFQAVVLISELKKGESVLVHAAASGVGVAAIQLAKFIGAKNVIATASTDAKLSWLRDVLGATHTANYKTEDFSQTVKAATGGKGVDVVVDFVGRTHWERNIDSLAADGTMVLLAALSGSEIPNANVLPILYKRLRIQGSTLRSRSEEYQADLIRRFQDAVVQNLTGQEGDGKIKTYIHKVYPWTEIQDATREMENAANSGKIIVEVV